MVAVSDGEGRAYTHTHTHTYLLTGPVANSAVVGDKGMDFSCIYIYIYGLVQVNKILVILMMLTPSCCRHVQLHRDSSTKGLAQPEPRRVRFL